MPESWQLAFNMKHKEIWRAIPGFEGLYEVSNLGQIRRTDTGALKKIFQDPGSRRCGTLLWKNNKPKMMRVHRAVMLAFVGPPPKGMECCHNDGDASNNRLENLRWDTGSANQRDRVYHGTSNRGSRCAASKLSEADVLAIRADNRLQSDIAAEYGVAPNTISRIKSRKRWAHL